jgi:hypothetical protein
MSNRITEDRMDEWKKINFMNGKPVDSYWRIVNALIPYSGNPVQAHPRKKINIISSFRTQDLLLLTEGYAVVYREEGTCLGIVSSPCILGLIGSYLEFYEQRIESNYYILTGSNCVYYRCKQQDFVYGVENDGLWHDIARILASRIVKLEKNNRFFLTNNAYNKITTLLIELSIYPDEIRKNTNAQNFIQERTNLSRSIIMRILSAMNIAGEIVISRGRLLSINPDKMVTLDDNP